MLSEVVSFVEAFFLGGDELVEYDNVKEDHVFWNNFAPLCELTPSFELSWEDTGISGDFCCDLVARPLCG